MKTAPIVPAKVEFGADPGTPPRAPAFGDVYHPRQGAYEQARQVFLAGNGLPERWRGRARFAIAETGFGLGHNFLATWAAWRDDAARCERLVFVSVEKHPLLKGDLVRAHAASPHAALARELIERWPPLVAGLHTLEFEGGRVRLLLGLGEALDLLRHLVARIDAFYLDGFAPACNAAMWSPELLRSLARLAAPAATAATWSAARAVRDGLAAAGFEVNAAPGQGGKRDITLARYAPRFTAAPPPGRALPAHAPTHAVVVGAGLAGAMTAWALAHEGIACTVLERHADAAAEASGNPAGLWHGTVSADDGPHARWHRAAALHAARRIADAVAAGVAGSAQGLLRMELRRSLQAMQEIAARQGLPADLVRALAADEASARAGIALASPAWWIAHGGWVDPGALVRHLLEQTAGVRWQMRSAVQRLSRHGSAWHAIDASGRVLAEAPLVVLCNASDALRLAGLPAAWLHARRGQVSWCDAADARVAPWLPIAGGGYLLARPDGGLLFGATDDADDPDPALRDADHRINLARAGALVGTAPLRDGARLSGRVGWRAATLDRLPLVGLVPDVQAPRPARHDAARLFARCDGLFMHAGLGSRGITSAPLGAALIAAQASGAPWPLTADLVDAVDPARALRRQGAQS